MVRVGEPGDDAVKAQSRRDFNESSFLGFEEVNSNCYSGVFLSESFGQSGRKQRSIEMIKQLEKSAPKGGLSAGFVRESESLKVYGNRRII